jgi:hypothetical protein
VSWSATDLTELERRGISPAEASRQLELLRTPPPPARLARAATVGDGIERPSPERAEELIALGEAARRAGRLTKFVPASGAATRMFQSLVAVRERAPRTTADTLEALASGGDLEAAVALRFVDALPRLALARPLASRLGLSPAGLAERARRDELAPILDALLAPDGLDALRLPKALLPFHLRGDLAVTAFEEQLDEGLAYLASDDGRARFAFTVPPGARAIFEAALARWRQNRSGFEVEVAFSEQSPASDTLALDEDGEPARTAGGALLFRPSGHGALLGNLQATGADLALVKNIDNILPAARHGEIARARLLLVGRLVELERSAPRARPLRVCGMVPNAGEPGGGPFWVLHERHDARRGIGREAEQRSPEPERDSGPTVSRQIVESSQVALDDPAQAAIWRSSTHFNPVDLVCSLRDQRGDPFELSRFVDAGSSFVARKRDGGRELTVLERPGLWNGAMAGWETRFVELPAWTFAPVKSVLDLARPEHGVDVR